jgi:hypothetical protein
MAEKVDKITGFDFYKNFVVDKVMHSDEEIEKYYDVLSMNRLMSYDKMAIILALHANKHPFTIPKKAHYLYYMHGVEKRVRSNFLNVRKDKDSQPDKAILEKAKFFLPHLSQSRIIEILPIIEERLKSIKLEHIKGGKIKETGEDGII